MTTVITEGRRTGEFLVSEDNGYRSREQGTLLSGQIVKAGHVLGKVAHGTATATAFANNAVNTGVMGAVTVGAGAKPGVYKLVILDPVTNAGAFEVEGPDGIVIGTGKVATAFNTGGLGFTLADGSTDFIAGEGFTITVAAGSGKFKEWNSANADGSEVVAAISWANVDASAADHPLTIIARAAEVNGQVLEYFTGADNTAKALAKTQLAALGIIVR